MGQSKIPNPHTPYSVLATSTGNKTYANHIATLYSAYSALSSEERIKTAIKIGTDIYRSISTGSGASFSLSYGSYNASSMGIVNIRIQNSTTASVVKWAWDSAGNLTKTNENNTEYDGTVQLLYGV